MISVFIFINKKMVTRVDVVNVTAEMTDSVHDYNVNEGEGSLRHKRSLGAKRLAIKMLKWAEDKEASK